MILRLTYLLNKKNTRLSFCMAEPGKGITHLAIKEEESPHKAHYQIDIDLSHLLTSTDFYIIDESKYSAKREKESRPDVYIFHELVHSYHHLHNAEEYDSLSQGVATAGLVYGDIFNRNHITASLQRSFPKDPRAIDYEEMRTIIGVPYTSGEFIVCENMYRLERKMPLRVNLLDAAKEGYNGEDDEVIQPLIKRITPVLRSQY